MNKFLNSYKTLVTTGQLGPRASGDHSHLNHAIYILFNNYFKQHMGWEYSMVKFLKCYFKI